MTAMIVSVPMKIGLIILLVAQKIFSKKSNYHLFSDLLQARILSIKFKMNIHCINWT